MNKIVYITNVRLPTEKAHGLQIVKSCEAFAENGATVELVAPHRFNSIKQDPFSYYKLKRNFKITKIPSIDLFPINFIPKRLSFYIQSLSFSVLGLFYALTRRGNTIFYSRDYATLFLLCLLGLHPVAEIHDYRSKKPKRAIQYSLRRARKIIVNSEGTLQALRCHYDFDTQKVLVAPNGVDLDFFNIPETRDEARKKLGIPSDRIIIGYIGSLETVGMDKGIGILVEAFQKLYRDREGLSLYIIGGPDRVAKEYRRKIASDKIFLTGHVEYSQVPYFLRAIDVAVIPMPENQHSKTTSPIKLFEYLAAGKPIVASDIPSLREYLGENNSLFFEPEKPDDLSRKISELLNNRELVNKISSGATKDSLNYSWLSRAEKILQSIPS